MAQEIYHRSEWGNPNEQWGNVYLNADLTNELYKRASEYENSWVTDQLLNGVGIKPSIILTPTAYEDGILNSVKPVQSLGNELVTNGSFDTDSDWVKQTGWSISDGKAVSNGSNAYLIQSSIVSSSVNKIFKISFTVSDYVSGSWNIGVGGYDFYQTSSFSDGDYTVYAKVLNVSANNNFYFRGFNLYASIDNVSVKEVIDADFDFTRGSSATRVNEKGLVQDVQILSGELVQNGNFEQIGSELITNGDFSNGETNWDFGGDWNLVNGTAEILTSTNSFLIQSNVVDLSVKTYKIQYEVVSTNGSNFWLAGGNSAFGTVNLDSATIGVKTVYLTSNGTKRNLQFNQNAFRGSIDNVSVKEVGQNWVFGSGWSMGDGKAVSDGSANDALRYETTFNPSILKIKFDVNDLTQGRVRLFVNTPTFTQLINATSNGSYETTVEVTSGANNLYFFSTDNFIGSIDNISVIEITDDTDLPRINYTNFDYKDVLGDELVTNGSFDTDSNWSKGTGWSISGGKAFFNNATGTEFNQSLSTTASKYRISFDLDITSGTIQTSFSSPSVSTVQSFTTSGSKTVDITTTASFSRFRFVGLGGSVFNIDNVSVKELTEDVVVPYSGEGSLLLEPQSTNLVTYSEDFSQSVWEYGGDLSIESGYTAPDGSNTAYKVTSTNSALAANLSATSTQARSIWAKTVSGTGTIQLLTHNSNTNNTFTITSQWQRFEINTTTSSIGLPFFYAVDFRGASTTLSEVILWGAQLEELSYATSYIPTEGSTKTRLADVCNNSGSSDLINSTEGVLYADISALADDLTNRFISLTDGTQNNSVCIFYGGGSSNFIRSEIKSNNVTQAELTTTSYPITNYNKIAVSYAENNFALWVNGVKVAADTSGSTPIGLNNLSFNRANILTFFGKTKCVAVFKEALSDTELQKLTTI